MPSARAKILNVGHPYMVSAGQHFDIDWEIKNDTQVSDYLWTSLYNETLGFLIYHDSRYYNSGQIIEHEKDDVIYQSTVYKITAGHYTDTHLFPEEVQDDFFYFGVSCQTR